MVNTMLTRKKFNLGIGCIDKEYKNQVGVKFGFEPAKKCNLNSLNIIDSIIDMLS